MSNPSPLAPGNTVASQRQFLVTISPDIEGMWATKSGAETSADTTDVYDGGSITAEKLAGPPTTDNLTVSRPFRPGRDAAIVRRLRPRVGSFRATVSVQLTDADLLPIGTPTVYANALLVRLAEPEADAASGDASMIELEFAIESVA